MGCVMVGQWRGRSGVLHAVVSEKELARGVRDGLVWRRGGRLPVSYSVPSARAGEVVIRVAPEAPLVPARGDSVSELPIDCVSCAPRAALRAGAPTVRCAGGVVLSSRSSSRVLLLGKMEESGLKWVLPKGRRRSKERLVETARREVFEESALHLVELGERLGDESYFDRHAGRTVFKVVTFFRMRSLEAEPVVAVPTDEGFECAAWVTIDDALSITRPLRAHRVLAAIAPRQRSIGQTLEMRKRAKD